MSTRRIVDLLLVLALLAAARYGAWWSWRTCPEQIGQVMHRWGLTGSPTELSGQRAPGIIEADAVTASSEMGGRIAELLVDEGDTVETGQLLVRLDASLLEAQLAQADAAVAVAEAQVALVSAAARPEEWRVAPAAAAGQRLSGQGRGRGAVLSQRSPGRAPQRAVWSKGGPSWTRNLGRSIWSPSTSPWARCGQR